MSAPAVIFLKTFGSLKDFSDPLGRMGFKSEGFAEARTFLMRLREKSPMACLVDASGEDSTMVLALMRSVRTVLGANLPMLVVVAGDRPDLLAKAKEAGASGMLTRPFQDDELLGLIAEHAKRDAGGTIEVPKPVKWFFDTVLPALAGLGAVLDVPAELEAQVRFCEERLQPYREPFIALVRALRKSDAKLDLVQCIRMYGVRNTRNLLVAMRLSDLTGQTLVGFNAKTGALVGDPRRVLTYSIRTLEHYGEGSRNQLEAFNAGLVLDLLAALADTTGTRKSAVRNFIEERYIEAIQNADAGIEAGKAVKNLALERHIVSAVLMREAGRAAMAVFFPEYLEKRRKMDARKISTTLQHIVEFRFFAISTNLMGALICQGAPGLSDAYKSTLFFDYPYLVKGSPTGVDTYDLIRVCRGSAAVSEAVSQPV